MGKYKDYPDFKPNLSPRQIFKMGSFGGTYFRTIESSVTGKTHNGKIAIREYPSSWFKDINIDTHVISQNYDKNINKYKVKCGSSLEDWENNNWIIKQDPYGWFQWYCRFYQGRRTKDDERQIKRWLGLAGPNGRFKKRLMNLIIQKKKNFNDPTVSPVIRQVLLHWGCQLTQSDLNKYKSQNKKKRSKKRR
jgi:hypothetical protein